MASDGDQKPEGLVRPLVKVAGILGMVEGFAWVFLSAAALVFYYIDLTPSSDKELSHVIYIGLFNKSYSATGFIMDAQSMRYFSFIYLVLSFCWFVISCLLFWSAIKKKTNEKLYDYSVLSWTIAASLSSILDLVLLCLFAHDYSKYEGAIKLVAVGILMTLAARGFVLWIVNVLFAVILGMHYYNRYNQISPSNNESAIDAYADPLPWLQGPAAFDDSPLKTYDNKGYQNDEPVNSNPPSTYQYPIGSDRDSARNNYVNTRNIHNSREPPQINFKRPVLNNNNNDSSWIHKNRNNYVTPLRAQPEPEFVRTAKIGKQGGQRSPSLNVSSPYIPDPDYSPPSSPNPRGVLRPKSNYTMY